MEEMFYWKLINKYITGSWARNIYVTHVALVTSKAIGIAKRLELSNESIRFIEEAAMLHDIGIVKVKDPEIGCYGELDYICHGTEGRRILEYEGFPEHALVCERHTGVGISKEDIVSRNLPIPQRNMFAESIEEKIISWSDLFFTKNPKKLLNEKSIPEARKSVAKFGDQHALRFDEWYAMFGD